MIKGRREVCLAMNRLRSVRIFSLITPQSAISSVEEADSVLATTWRALCNSPLPSSATENLLMAATLAEIKSRMLLPRPVGDAEAEEIDPRAELVRRLQEYERFKRAAENIDALPRLERDVHAASAAVTDRKVVRLLPQVQLREMLLAFQEVVHRAELFAHHHVQRERLSVRARMTDILSTLGGATFVEFGQLFKPEEGRMGVTVTFVAVLELVREGLIDLVQNEPYAPLHVRTAVANHGLKMVVDNDDVEALP